MIPVVDLNKFRAKCKCIDATLTDTQLEELLLPSIYVVSKLTDWQKNGCNTLYKALRTENRIFEPPKRICECKEPIKLENKLIDSSTISVKLYIDNNDGEKEYTFQPSAILYSKANNSIKLDLTKQVYDSTNTLVDLTLQCRRCERYTLVIEYMAGYTELPDCVIESICGIYSSLNLAKVGCNTDATNTQTCTNLDKLAWNARLTDIKVGDIEYTFDYTESSITDVLTQKYAKLWYDQIHVVDNQVNVRYIGLW